MNMKISAVVITSALVGMQVQAMEKALIGLTAVVLSAGAYASSNGSSEAPNERKEQKQEQPARPTTPESIAQAELKAFNAQVAEESRALNERAEKQRAKLRVKIEEARRKKADREEAARKVQEAAREAAERKGAFAALTGAPSNEITAMNENFIVGGKLSFAAFRDMQKRITVLEQEKAARDARAAARVAEAARKRQPAPTAPVVAPEVTSFVQTRVESLNAQHEAESKVSAAGVSVDAEAPRL